jgi:hypothetical protein
MGPLIFQYFIYFVYLSFNIIKFHYSLKTSKGGLTCTLKEVRREFKLLSWCTICYSMVYILIIFIFINLQSLLLFLPLDFL